LLHGFPETSIMWEPLLEKLSKAGYRVVAFDQRGYSPGARPYNENAYTKGTQERTGFSFGDCYYRHRLCTKQAKATAVRSNR
jgi:pimeloyl-ACP methyl ester carboxylesterase